MNCQARALWTVVLMLVACGGRDPTPQGDDSTTEAPGTTSTGGVSSTGGLDSSGGESAESESSGTTGDPNGCGGDQPIPPPPLDCSEAQGVLAMNVAIEEGGDDPAVLEGIRRVEGSISVRHTALANLSFMACIEEVTGSVTIFGNEQLVDVSGLWSLQEIGADFIFSENDALVEFDGLPNLPRVNTNLVMKNNASLAAITGFQSLVEIEGNLTIQNNPVLTNIEGLIGLMVIHGVFAVSANPVLCTAEVNCVGAGIIDPAQPPPSWGDPGPC